MIGMAPNLKNPSTHLASNDQVHDGAYPSYQAYFRCPKGFVHVLSDDLAELSTAFKSLTILKKLSQGVIVEGSANDIAAFTYISQAIEKAVLIFAQMRLERDDIGEDADCIHDLFSDNSNKTDSGKDISGKGMAGKKASGTETFLASLKKSMAHLLPNSFTFRTDVVADPHVTEGFWRQEQEISLSGVVATAFAESGKSASVSLKDAQVTFVGVFEKDVKDSCLIVGVDLAGRDLSKRPYKIISTGVSVKGTLAYCLMRSLEIKEGKIFLDPSCGTGEVCIEATLFAARISPWLYNKDGFSWLHILPFKELNPSWLEGIDKSLGRDPVFIVRCVSPHFGHLSIARKHAKIAGVEHLMQFSRIEYKWLDAKFAKGEVDVVASALPPFHSGLSDQQKEKEAKLLFYQLEYLLRKEAKIILMTHDPDILETASSIYGFRKIGQQEAFMGLKPVILQSYVNETKKTKNDLG
jgi:23S rRNA G2445 N2-methylase RlmL